MPNTNFQTIFQMPGIVNNIVKQATGRDAVSQIDMDFVTVGQDKQTVPHEIDYTAVASFVNNNQLPLSVMAKIAAVQSGTGDPSPENIRPITGWTGANIRRMGKNLLSPDGFTVSGNYLVKQDVVPTGMIARMSITDKDTSIDVSSCSIGFVETPYIGSPVNFRWCISNGTINQTTTNSAQSDNTIKCNSVLIYPNTEETRNKLFSRYNIMVEFGTTKTDYVPYNGHIYSITFPEAAGTVYGGTLNVTTGVLIVTMGEIESYNGETLPGAWMSDRDVYAAGTSPTEGAQVVYELAEPVTYECDPEEIDSLIGINYVWADTGDVSVSYTSYIPVI